MVTGSIGAASPLVATLQKIAVQVCGVVPVFPVAGPAVHPAGVDGSVTEVVAAR